ncbi:MAG: hypothetical protein Q6373_009775 [Candidatus Sigynarchaeota archaeon]
MKIEHVVRQARGSIVNWMKGKEEYKGINGQIKAIWRARVILTIVALSSIPSLWWFVLLLVVAGPIKVYGFIFYAIRSQARKKDEAEIIPWLATWLVISRPRTCWSCAIGGDTVITAAS